MKEFTAIGIDVGGTKIAAGLVTFPHAVVHVRETIPTLPTRGGEAVLRDIMQLAIELQDQSRHLDRPVGGIGVGVCEIVTTDGAVASESSLQWSGHVVRDKLSSIAPVTVEADVRAAARAEALFGAGRGLDCFLYVSIGTGISSCLVIDGQPFVGSRGAPGTLASGPFPRLHGEPPNSAQTSLEQLAAGPALVARFNALGENAQSAREVLAAAAAGNRDAMSVVLSGATAVGAAIGWLVNVLDPHSVILGGGLGMNPGVFRDTLVNSARRHIWWVGHRDLPMVEAQTGVDAGMIGAAVAAWSHSQKRPDGND